MRADLLIVTVPRRSPNMQYACVVPESLGRLKANCERAGFNIDAIDLNIEYFRNTFIVQDIFSELEEHFQDVEDRDYINTSMRLSESTRNFWCGMVDKWSDEIIKRNPKRVGISVFSDQSLRAAFDLCYDLKKKCSDIKIVMGGLPMSVTHNDELSIGDLFIRMKAADDYLSGEAEQSLVEYLGGKRNGMGINGSDFKQIQDLNSLAYADYSWANFKNYTLPNPNHLNGILRPMISISGSRGCTKACLFCDVGHFWPKYRLVRAKRLSDEIIHYYEKYGIKNFHFSDSIVNASVPEFTQLLDFIIDYTQNNNVQFYFMGQMIVREIRHFPEEMFLKMKRAGFGTIMYGVESGSFKVRAQMNKPYSQESLLYTLDMCAKYKIIAQAMIIVGYPTELEEDFQQTCDLFRRYADKNNSERYVLFSISTFTMDDDSKECRLHRDHEQYGIYFDDIKGWTSSNISRFEALERTIRAYDLIEELNYPIYKEWKTEVMNDYMRIKNLLEITV